MRDLLEAPQGALAAPQEQMRRDLLDRFGDFSELVDEAARLRIELQQTWLPAMDEDGVQATTRLWKEYAESLAARELRLGEIALAPVPAESSFPRLIRAAELQASLQPGQAQPPRRPSLPRLPPRSRLSMSAQLPTSTEERQFKLLSVTVRGVDLTFIREPSGAI